MGELGLMDLLSVGLSQGGHTGGHFAEASSQGVPMKLSGLQEVWDQPDVRKDVDINGAGFGMQDLLSRGLGGTELEKTLLANALIKGGYVLGLPGVFDRNLKGYGDIENIERLSGNRFVRELVILSALSDLYNYGSGNNQWGVGLSTFGTGQPGLMFNYRW